MTALAAACDFATAQAAVRVEDALTELKQFDGRGHSLTIDGGWQVIALDVLAWLKANGL
jgi:non-heme chloroperoxidase